MLSQLVPLTERALIKLAYGHFHIAADAVGLLWVNQFMTAFIWECCGFGEVAGVVHWRAGECLWHEMRHETLVFEG